MNPYRVMVDCRYFYVGEDIDNACRAFRVMTAERATAYYGDKHMAYAEPMVVALDAQGNLVGTLMNVSFDDWVKRYPIH